MKTLILILLLPVYTIAQTLEIPPRGMTIKKGEIIVVDTLKNNSTILMQDNSKLYIKESIVGDGQIIYGDDGTDTTRTKESMVKLVRIDSYTGKEIHDYRDQADYNPEVIFEKCTKDMINGLYVDSSGETIICGENALGINEFYTNKELAEYQSKVYNTLGQELYSGKYKNIPIIYNKLLFIKVFINGKGIFYIKKIIIK